MKIISVRLNKDENAILKYLMDRYGDTASSIIKTAIQLMYLENKEGI